MSKASKTDWKPLSQHHNASEMKDDEIDTSDIAELDDEFYQKAKLRTPNKKSITIRIDDRGAFVTKNKWDRDAH